MPFAPPSLVLEAVEALDNSYPLAVVTFPALLRAARQQGVDPVNTGVEFRSTQELELLEEFFELPRPPDPTKPFRAPWSKRAPWQTRKFPGGGLQRQRTYQSGRGRVLIQQKASAGGVGDIWRLTQHAGAELLASGTNLEPTRIVDLAIWFGRNIDVAQLDPGVNAALPPQADDVDRLIAWFKYEFDPDVADLIGTVYLDDVPSHYRDVPFEPTPIGDDTFIQLGSMPPAPTVNTGLADLVLKLEELIGRRGFQLPPRLVNRVLNAWLRGDIVVLVGQPGTGKTMFASLLAGAMQETLDLDPPITVAVREDFDETELIGYERLDGKEELRAFAQEVLANDNPLEAKVVVLEEFNLASIEAYLSSVLVATQQPERRVMLPGGALGRLPIDTFIIATCNSYRDEPETRTRVSSPTKRRSTVITMPNVLADRFEESPNTAVIGLADELIKAEAQRVSARQDSSTAVQFDSLRSFGLSGAASAEALSEAVRKKLNEVSSAILGTAPGRSWFTLGLLRDVVLAIVYAARGQQSELEALGEAVADKLIHQVRGAHSDVEELREVCAELPNAAEIDNLLARMMDGPSDELLTLL